MSGFINRVAKMRLFQGELDNHLIRASMVFIYFIFGYQKWFQFEAQGLAPFFTHGPLIFWMYPVFGVRGSAYVLGFSESCYWQASGARRSASSARLVP